MKGKISKPVIFEYDNYRLFLKALYDWLKSEKNFFSFRQFSKKAGYRSPNFLKLVIDGKRNISPASIEKFALALKLNKEEINFFRHLVLLNQAGTVEEKKFYASELVQNRFYKKAHPLKKAQYDYYANWYLVPIRELVGLKNFREDPEWISKQLNPFIAASEAKKALITLEQLGLIQRNEEGKLIQTNSFIATGDEVASSSVAQFHRDMMQKGSEAIDRFPAAKREISGLTLGLSEEGATKIKKRIQEFKKELLMMVSQEENPTTVYQLNFQYFPLSHEETEREDK